MRKLWFLVAGLILFLFIGFIWWLVQGYSGEQIEYIALLTFGSLLFQVIFTPVMVFALMKHDENKENEDDE
ncbi:hypothetical protein [Lentilactobacillus sp. Marseille-Q4993]|uniref:hypothetical protein n=1 Tax=Lentilactobacillus sp. Marseille-Q4993 TaxID=3039492 RepID=UPI0024BD32EC|nr:hypothetical protein [Lentilactobacillus sp. Marseille-Q4993]